MQRVGFDNALETPVGSLVARVAMTNGNNRKEAKMRRLPSPMSAHFRHKLQRQQQQYNQFR